MTVEVRLLGRLEVHADDRVLTTAGFPSRKARQVFEALALARGRVVTKDTLIDTVWHRRWPENPAATVEVAVSLMRSALAKVTGDHLVITEPGGYRIDPAAASVDVAVFDELVEVAGRCPQPEQLSMLRTALALVRGPLLEDEVGAQWLQPERDRARRRIEAARLACARLALTQDEPDLAYAVAEQAWMNSDLVLEEAYGVGITALVDLGRVSEARALHAAALHRVRVEDDRPPSLELEQLASLFRPVARPRLDLSIAIDPAFDEAPPSLPFVGRTAELAIIEGAIERARSGASSLVEVVGPTGIGKSRLLAEVRERQLRTGRTDSTHLLRLRPDDHAHPLLAAGRMMRSVAKAAERPMPALDDGFMTMFGRFTGLLDDVGPTVLLVDDLQHADPGTVEMLHSLVAPGGAEQLGLVVTQRTPDEPDLHLEPDSDDELMIRLGPLTRDELETEGLGRAWPETGGNPAILVACCDAAAHDGIISGAAAQRLMAPVDALGPVAIAVLCVASALTGIFSADDVAMAAQMGVDVVSDSVGRAAESSVLRSLGDGRFSFAADVLRRLLRLRAHPLQ